MKFTWWSRSKKQAAPRMERRVYEVKLLHDFGHDIVLPNVSEENLRFIQENIGRDLIYTQELMGVNLRSFSFYNARVQKDRPLTDEPDKYSGERRTTNGR
jgi:hypothetical protein